MKSKVIQSRNARQSSPAFFSGQIIQPARLRVLGRCAPAFLGLLFTVHGNAQSSSEDSTLFGMFSQLNSAVTYANGLAVNVNACVPTATVDGLSYLYNYAVSENQSAPLSYSPTYTSVNNLAMSMGTFNNNLYRYYNGGTLAATSINAPNANYQALYGNPVIQQNVGGTYTYDMFNGLQSYLGAGGANPAPGISISGEIGGATPISWLGGNLNPGMNVANAIPTAQYLANNLNAHNAVELTLEWGTFNNVGAWQSKGGHEVLLWSVNLGNNNTGTIQMLDPWGTGNGATSATATANGLTADIFVGADGYLYGNNFSDTPADENPSDPTTGAPGAPGAGIYFRIDDVMVEAVPEPGVLGLYGGIAGLILAWVLPKRTQPRIA